jgi:hypothetical protein
MIPENKVADCENVMFKQGRVKRRYGFSTLGTDHLNGAITGIAYYEQVRLGNKYTLVFTSRDAYLYDTQTGRFTPISLNYSTGKVLANATAIAETAGGTWLSATWTLLDTYQIKFGTNVASTDAISFTGTCGAAWTDRTGSGSRDWRSIASSSNGTKLVACDYAGHLYTSADSGATWTERDSHEGWIAVASSSDGVKLVACSAPGLIYTSTDSGANWTMQASSGTREWRSVASSSDGVKLVACADSGLIYTSTDSGANWTSTASLASWRGVSSSSDGSKLVACVYGGQIYTSTDSGANWTARDSNRSWYSVASSSDGVNLVACVYGGQLYTSTDSGATWVARDSNRSWRGVASSSNGERLAAVAYNGYIYTSTDYGVTWIEQTSAGAEEWMSVASSSDGTKLAGAGSSTDIWTCLNSPTTITSVSSTSNLYVGLELTATFLSAGTRIAAISYSPNIITIDRGYIAEATAGAISADISTWYDIHSIDSAAGLTLNALAAITGTLLTSTAQITVSSSAGLYVGMGIKDAANYYITANTYILSIDSDTLITLNNVPAFAGTGISLTCGLRIINPYDVDYIINLCFNGGDDDYWSFAYPYEPNTLKDKILCASNGVESIYKWDGSGAIEVLGGTPPATAKYIGYFGAAAYEHFIAAWTTDTGNNLPQTIEMSEAGEPEGWSASSYYDLLQKNDEIVGIDILKGRLVIYKSRSISMAYPTPEGGNTDPFDIEQDVIIDIEIPAGRTVVNFGDYHLFLGLDNVYKFNGVGLEPIGSEIVNTMKNEWNGPHMDHAFAFAIPNENLYCLFIPTLAEYDVYGNITKAEAEYPDKAYVYNYQEGTWTIWTFDRQFTCSGYANKGYTPTIADIDALNRSWADMDLRWADMVSYSTVQSILLGDTDGYVYEFRDSYSADEGGAIGASFTTRDYPMNDPVHVFMLLEAVLGMSSRTAGDIQIEASVDFGETWSDPVVVNQAGAASYVEYIANFLQKGLQARFRVTNIDGADFEVESIMIGFNDELGHKKSG